MKIVDENGIEKIFTLNEFKDFLKEVVAEVIEEQELITEGTVYNNLGYKIGVFNDAGERLKTDPYFKFAPTNQRGYDKCARISIFRPEYIIHPNGGIHLELSRKNKDVLMKILPDIWNNILDEIIKLTNPDKELETKIRLIPIPDYYSLSMPSHVNCRKERW